MSRFFCAFVLALFSYSVLVCSPDSASPQLLRRTANIMGTTFSIETVPGPNAEAAADAALDEARRVDRLLSNYRPDSELSQINAHGSVVPVRISPELFQLLSECIEYSRASEGSFDITVGPLMKTWGFYKDSGHLANHAAVEGALSKMGWRHIILNASDSTVFLDRQGVELDPGGVGKGYAVDRMVAVLRQKGVAAALVSAGGSSIYGLGHPANDGRGWQIIIQDPRDEKKTAATVYLCDQSLSTSGSYERFFWADGKIYSHIMDPRTGYPATGAIAVSVLSPRTLDSEVWAKPYYILGRSWTEAHKPKDFKVLFCADAPDASCEWVH
jgi:FAD:protein FMN transferase